MPPKYDVTLAGESCVDLIMYDLPQTFEPEREYATANCAITLGGSSAILAHNLSMLGAKVGFITALGSDPFAVEIQQRLDASGVDYGCSARKNIGTGFTVLLPHARDRHMFTFLGNMSELRGSDLDFDFLSSTRHFHLSSLYLNGFREQIPDLFRQMKSLGISTSLDTNDDPADEWAFPLKETLAYTDIVFPNEREVLKIAGETDLERAVSRIANEVRCVVVKQGPAGALAICPGRRYSAPAIPVSVVDTIGAGDSFDAGFLFQFTRGAEISECLEFANLAGSFSTTASGGTEAFRIPGNWSAFLAAHSQNARLY